MKRRITFMVLTVVIFLSMTQGVLASGPDEYHQKYSIENTQVYAAGCDTWPPILREILC